MESNSRPFVREAMPQVHQKLLGTIIGSALGDTIGLYTEFLPATATKESYPSGKFTLLPSPTPFRPDSHRDRFAQAAWTDDTDHALLLVLGYLHSNGDLTTLPKDFANRLAIWSNQGLRCLDRPPLGIGRTIGWAARDPRFPEYPEAVALEKWIQSGRNGAANGSLMRTHPLGLMVVRLGLEEAFNAAAVLSRTTHPDPRCVVACCAAVGLVRGIVRGEILSEREIDAMLESAFEYVAARPELSNPQPKPVTTRSDGDEDENTSGGSDDKLKQLLDHAEYASHVHAKTFADLQLDDSIKMGYVYKCLGAAVLALRQAFRLSNCEPAGLSTTSSTIFESIITELTMAGGDADTNACVAGAFIGAWLGFDRLPAHWRDGLAHRDWLINKSERLSRLLGIMEPLDGGEKADPHLAPDGGKPLMTTTEMQQRDAEFVEIVLKKQAERREKEKRRSVFDRFKAAAFGR